MLTRKQLVLRINEDATLPYNYYYPLMTSLYGVLTEYDREKAVDLHENGVEADGKRFKLFTHTLLFENAKFTNSGIEVKAGDSIKLLLSGKETIIEDFMKAIAVEGGIVLQGYEMKLLYFEEDKVIRFTEECLFKVMTPVISCIWEKDKGRRYLSPSESRFFSTIEQNLRRKYLAVHGKPYIAPIYFEIEDISSVKRKPIRKIKNQDHIGYGKFNIKIIASPELQQIAYYLGIGEKNSVGAGFLGFVKGVR